ncbi:MAG: FHA domain-containing protein [Myxococcaceae bacterium]
MDAHDQNTVPPGKLPPTHVKELRQYATAMDKERFVKHLGPFVLVKAPTPEDQQKLAKLGQRATMLADKARLDGFALTADLDSLIATTLPPLNKNKQLTVGRTPENDLVIDDPSVSKRHALVKYDEQLGRFIVADQGSRNGTSLNGVQIEKTRLGLDDGDLLSFGSAHFLYFRTGVLYSRLRGEDDGAFVIERR